MMITPGADYRELDAGVQGVRNTVVRHFVLVLLLLLLLAPMAMNRVGARPRPGFRAYGGIPGYPGSDYARLPPIVAPPAVCRDRCIAGRQFSALPLRCSSGNPPVGIGPLQSQAKRYRPALPRSGSPIRGFGQSP